MGLNEVTLELLVVDSELVVLVLHVVDDFSLVVKVSVHLCNLSSLFSLFVPYSLSLALQVLLTVPNRVLFVLDVISKVVGFSFQSQLFNFVFLELFNHGIYTLLATLA